MRRVVMVAALAFGALALAEEQKGGEEREDVAAFILHHVANSNEYELEIPLNTHGGNPKLVFPDWRVSLKPGGCPIDRHVEVPFTQCLDLSLTKHAFMMMLAALVLVLLLWSVPHRRDPTQLVPKGRKANTIEYLVAFVRKIAIDNIGKEKADKYTPYLLTIFFFILTMNLFGLIPGASTPTGNLGVTAALALCTFILTQAAGIRAGGFLNYLKHLTGGVHWLMWPIMVPVEILGLFTKPFALTVRLFANMVAGHIVIFFLLGLISILQSVFVAGAAVPFAAAIYFLEIFIAAIQAFIFTMLSALFIGLGVAMAHHADHPHPEDPERDRPVAGGI